MPSSNQIRQQFIDYFVGKCGHTEVPSSPVVPHDDPTLLFANAGMNQFKDVFLGTGRRWYTRATNTQKCIRAGGKHNDLDDIGKDTYHHTFFEMLGNWSFGDYFKAEAIEWAWDLLTGVWQLPKDRLHVTVFAGDEADNVPSDDEAAELWQTLTDLDPSQISRWGKKDNFWEMADTGPCGPNSEIHIDLTADRSGRALVNRDDPRVIELWNLVFIQFNRGLGGQLTPLPAKHVDTGMGFERVVAVLQGKGSNYDTDVFSPLFATIADVTGAEAYSSALEKPEDIAYRVIADHIRCLTVALTDGAHCGNEGRDYVLRRILRRAVRYGRQTLGVEQPFFYRLVPAVVDAMGDAFSEMRQNPNTVADEIREEEESFSKTLGRGIALFEEAATRGGGQIPAEDAFRLHDTYGFPVDLTQLMAEERGKTVDVDGFEKLMDSARRRSREVGVGANARASLETLVQQVDLPETEFSGYDQTECPASATALHVFRVGNNCGLYKQTEKVEAGNPCAVVVERTPFYAEAGGQVGDKGVIQVAHGARIRVDDTIKIGQIIFHLGQVVAGTLEPTADAQVALAVDRQRRALICANHTTTHVMNRALRDQVNADVQQKGSLVDDEKTRFDFSHGKALTPDELDAVEKQVNDDITADLRVHASVAPQQESLKISGLRAVFGEKYPPNVRIVSIGVPPTKLLEDPGNADWAAVSVEFCGGTHLASTGQAECFVIVQEEPVSRGVRRLTALTGAAAQEAAAQGQALLRRIAALDETKLADEIASITAAMKDAALPAAVRRQLHSQLADLQKKLKAIRKQETKDAAGGVVDAARRIAETGDGKVIVSAIDGADADTLRTAMDVIKKKKPDSALLLGAVNGDKISFVAAVPKPLIDKGLKAGDWVKQVAQVAGGGGGGRPDMAQAGGKDPSKLAEALDAAKSFAKSKLN